MVGDDPTGHFAEVAGANSAVRAGVYKVNPGEYPDGVPVPYEFDRDEYLYVLEGEVEVWRSTRLVRRPASAQHRRPSHRQHVDLDLPCAVSQILGGGRLMAQQQSDVVVIGGGFAGLAAGREAARLGCDVTLVEASDRLGGRTWTTDGLGTRVELGGTDVHWLQPNAWTEVARYGLEIEEFAPPERVLYLHDGAIHEGTVEEVGAQMEKAMTALSTLAREVLPRPQDAGWEPKILEYDGLTLGAFLDELALHPLERDITTSFWSAACQAPLDEVGVVLALRWLALAGWDWEVMLDVISRYKIVGGMGQLSAAIAAETEAAFAMNTRVAEVRSNGRGVEVVPDRRSHRRSGCRVRVPLNVLDDIRFDPGLPDALAELAAEGQLSRGLKVVCRIKGDRAPYMCLAPEGAPFVWMQYDQPLDGDHIAVAFGADASGVDGSSPAAVQTALREWLPDVEVVDARTTTGPRTGISRAPGRFLDRASWRASST